MFFRRWLNSKALAVQQITSTWFPLQSVGKSVSLINRTTRSLHLTEEGWRYLEKMEMIRVQVEQLRSVQQDNQAVKGHIKLTAPMMMGQYVLPKALAEFKRIYPQIRLSISLMNRKIDLVEEGVDLAVRVGHLADSSMVARKIGSMPLKTVASSAYFKQHGCPEHPKELSVHNCLINTAISTPKRWTYQVGGKAITVKVGGELEANESLCIKAFAMAGQGIAQLPNFYVDNAIASQQLIEMLTEYAPQPLPINLIYPSQRLLSPAVKALIEFLMDYMDVSIQHPI